MVVALWQVILLEGYREQRRRKEVAKSIQNVRRKNFWTMPAMYRNVRKREKFLSKLMLYIFTCPSMNDAFQVKWSLCSITTRMRGWEVRWASICLHTFYLGVPLHKAETKMATYYIFAKIMTPIQRGGVKTKTIVLFLTNKENEVTIKKLFFDWENQFQNDFGSPLS